MSNKQNDELSKNIFVFHQTNYGKGETHQAIEDPKSSYFQYSRYHAILQEFQKMSFDSFLDMGCAEGMYLEAVKKQYPSSDVYGVDFSPIALKKAKQIIGEDFYLTSADATHLPFKDSSVDIVLCSETLEHIVDDDSAIKELSRICKKTLIITVPSFRNQKSKSKFKPDIECRHDSHLRKYLRSDLTDKLAPLFNEVSIHNLSLWTISSADIVSHLILPRRLSGRLSHLLAPLASIDYQLCKSGAYGHSFICICNH